MQRLKGKSFCLLLHIIFCLNFCFPDVQATIIFSDTLVLKPGECIPLAGEDNDRRPFIWTTGNQDIANIESVFGKPKVCGVFEGITYVSGSTISSEGQHKIITPFENENFLRPVLTAGNNPEDPEEYDWWDHLEFIINKCIEREMFVCLLPTWREQWNHNKNLHENNAFAYGKFIGQRHRRYNPWIIWVMGGDEAPDTPVKLQIHRELAKGITWGINGKEDYSNILSNHN